MDKLSNVLMQLTKKRVGRNKGKGIETVYPHSSIKDEKQMPLSVAAGQRISKFKSKSKSIFTLPSI